MQDPHKELGKIIQPNTAVGQTTSSEAVELKPGQVIGPQKPPTPAAAPTPAVAQPTVEGAVSKEKPIAPEVEETTTSDEATEDTSSDEPGTNPFISVGRTIFSWVILPALIVLFLHTFIFQAFYVSGSSMNPDFEDGDYLIIDKIGITLSTLKGAFGLGSALSIKRGDVLVFKYPNSPSTFFIKRLIGEPGDRVVVKDAKVTVYPAGTNNSITLKEPYTDPQYKTEGDIDEVVDKDKYFVMGDNRSPNGSFDSRAWGQLPKDDVVGVATTRLLPINNLGPIKHPTY